ncbi:hypothetical protein SRHO_G00147990 [Serrasalmus rhombeus]
MVKTRMKKWTESTEVVKWAELVVKWTCLISVCTPLSFRPGVKIINSGGGGDRSGYEQQRPHREFHHLRRKTGDERLHSAE